MNSTVTFLSDQQLLSVLASTNVATAIHVGEAAVIQLANDKMLAIWGKDKSVIGKSLEDALPELKGQPFIDLFKKVWNEGITISGTDTPADLVVEGKSQTFYFEFEYRAIKNEQGKTICILHTAVDITEQFLNREALGNVREKEEALKREQSLNEELAVSNEELASTNEELAASNEELYATQQRLSELNNDLEQWVESRVLALAESEERFRTMAEGTDVLIAVGDESSDAIYFNQAWVKLTGRSMEELLEFGWADLIHPEDRERYVNIYLSAFKIHAPFTGEFRIRNRKGEYRWLLATGPPRFRADGTFAGYISSCIDITELKEHAQQLQLVHDEMTTTNEQFRMAVSTAHLGTWRADLTTGKLALSERSRKLHGLKADEEIILDEALALVYPEQRENLKEIIKSTIEEAGSFEQEYKIQPRDGSASKWLLSTGKVYTNDKGVPVNISGTILDITERKENELRKNDFIGMVSHELKTPLTSLTAIIQLANIKLQNSDDPVLIDAMERANNQAKKMANMINGFLNISRLESGKILIQKQPFNIGALIQEIIAEIRLTVTTNKIEENICNNVIINADREKIGSVVSNLVSNAVKYSDPGKLIKVDCVKEADQITVSIIDEGIGIRPADVEKVFDRYYRVENKNTQHISGFGIGLYLSAEIISRHNGNIWVDSELGKGSAFHFSLPVE